MIPESKENVFMAKKELFGVCPYVTAQKVLTGKWSMYILYLLTDGPLRFNELQRRMPEEMTHTTLSRQLKNLEEEGLIVRTEYQQIPPKVEYSLSEIGEKFRDVLSVLEVWGNEYINFLNHSHSSQLPKCSGDFSSRTLDA
jgi:DNA-binding HxlR family transcriptional regulator